MGIEFILLALIAAFGIGCYSLLTHRRPTVRASLTRPRRSRPSVTPAMKLAARNLQLALLYVRQAPDFRRAAAFVAQARLVPAWFRKRQYQRFRPLLVEHFARLLQQGASPESLLPSLQRLIVGLGIADFEADYIRQEALSRATPRDRGPTDFSGQLRQAQQSYQQRVRALQTMPELDDEAREQLLEQERMRLEERLRSISEIEGNSHGR